MNRSFLIAVGIAAMDGLLCAFVAVLALAFLLQGTEAATSGHSEKGLLAIAIEKRSAVPGDILNNTIVMARARRGHGKCDYQWGPDFGRIAADHSTQDLCFIRARWLDCRAVHNACTAYLLLFGLQSNERYDLRFVVQNSINNEFGMPSDLGLAITAFDGSRPRGVALGTRFLRSGDPVGLTLTVEVSPSGEVQVR